MSTLDRLEVGIDRVSEAVDRLNELGRQIGMPYVALRCWDGHKWQSEHYFLGLVYDRQTKIGLEQIADIERAKGWINFPERESHE